MDDEKSFAVGQLDRLMAFFPRVEGKASFLFAVNLGMLATVGLGFPIATPMSFAGLFGSVTTAFLAASLLDVYRTFFPHLKGAERVSLFYFRDIASTTSDLYRARLRTSTDEELMADLSCQIWRNAKILTFKFDRMESAFRLTWCALIPWLVFLAIVTATTGAFPFKL